MDFFQTDWLLKRAFKIVLKQYLGRFIHSEVDLDLVRVEMGKGTLELQQILLKTDFLNERLAHTQWEVTSGYVECARISIPKLTNLKTEPCCLELEGLLFRIRPRRSAGDGDVVLGADSRGTAGDASPGQASSPSDGFGEELGGLGLTPISVGVASIAGGVETILQRAQVKARQIKVRVELPSGEEGVPASLIALELASLDYQGEASPADTQPAEAGAKSTNKLQKRMAFDGLTVKLFEDDTRVEEDRDHPIPPRDDCPAPKRVKWQDQEDGGERDVEQTSDDPVEAGGWEGVSMSDCQSRANSESGASSSGDHDTHVIICSHEGEGCSGQLLLTLEWLSNSQQRPKVHADLQLEPLQIQLHPHHLVLLYRLSRYFGSSEGETPPASPQNPDASPGATNPASRSFLADFLLPDTTSVAQDVYQSWMGRSTASQPYGAATEFYDANSLMGSVSSGVQSFFKASAASVAQGASYLAASAGPDWQVGSLVGTAEHPPIGTDIGGMKLNVETSNLSLVLWYPDAHATHEAGAGARGDYRPRLSVEAGDVLVEAESKAEGLNARVKVYRLEAVEHLPTTSASDSLSAAVLAESVRMLDALPAISKGSRPVPSFAGVCVNPMPRSSMYASMLSQVSLASSMEGLDEDSPRIEIWPVLCIAGGRRQEDDSREPSISTRVAARSDGSHGSHKAVGPANDVEVRIRPTSIWLGLPLAERMYSFLDPLILHLGAESTARGGQQAQAQGFLPSSVGFGDSVMHELNILEGAFPGVHSRGSADTASSKISLHLPRISVVVRMPESSPVPRTSLAIDISAVYSPTPTLTLAKRREGSRAAHWEAVANFSRAKAYLVEPLEGQMLSGLRGGQNGTDSQLEATCVLDMLPAQEGDLREKQAGGALTLDAQVRQAAPASSGSADVAWEAVKKLSAAEGGRRDRERAMEILRPQEAASAAAVLSLQVTAPDVCIQVSQAQVAALWSLASALLEWQGQVQAASAAALGYRLPLTQASPTTLELTCGLRCNLVPYSQGLKIDMGARAVGLFQVDARSLHVFAGLGLDGRAASTFCGLHAAGVRVATPGAEHPVLSCGLKHSAGFDVHHAQRQLDADSIASESTTCVSITGATLSTEKGDLSFSWYQRLASFFTLPSDSADSDSEAEAAAPGPTAATASSLALQLHDCAVRDDGPELEEDARDGISAALLLGSLHWQTSPSSTAQVIHATGLSLMAADASASSGESPGVGADDLPYSRLLDCGYACLAQEGGLTITNTPSDGHSDTGSAKPHSVAVSNRRLHLPLTLVAWHRLNRLIARWSASFGGVADSDPLTDLQPPTDDLDGLGPGPSGRPPDRVSILGELDEDAFAANRPVCPEEPVLPCRPEGEYFVPLPGGGVLDLEEEADVPGGAPVIIEDFFKDRFRPAAGASASQADPKSDDVGVNFWYTSTPGEESSSPIDALRQEEYVKQPPRDYVPASGQKCALGPLPEEYPNPSFTFTLCHFNVVAALCSTQTPQGEEGVEVVTATSARLEAELADACLQVDVFPPGGPHARRLALSIKGIEVRDCALRIDAAPAWKTVFGQQLGPTSPRGASACMLTMELESVRPEEGSGAEELRVRVSALPLRLRVDQDVLTFLQAFFQEAEPDNTFEAPDLEASPAAAPAQTGVFFQRCQIRATSVLIDYKPRRVDVSALRAGNLMEIANMTGWSEVAVALPGLTLKGVHGWDNLAAAVAQRYIADIISPQQVQNFLAGIKPLQGIIRIGTAAGQLLAIPADALKGRPEPQASNIPLSRQVQRGVFGLMRAIVAEGLGFSAGAMGGLHLVLAGPSAAMASSSQPSNATEGMRQAAERFASGVEGMGEAFRAPFTRQREAGGGGEYSGSGSYTSAAARALRAAPGALAKPLSGTAAAARCLLLGTRNSLDPKRYQKRNGQG